jgi:hypothetical protein
MSWVGPRADIPARAEIGVSTALVRRLSKIEASAFAAQEQRQSEAIRQACASLSREHAMVLRAWFASDAASATCGSVHGAVQFCWSCIEAADPPALIRAVWTVVRRRVEDGAPAVLPTNVAQVYVDYPDAVPGSPCSACSYLLPARGDRLAYAGACPGCSLADAGQQ